MFIKRMMDMQPQPQAQPQETSGGLLDRMRLLYGQQQAQPQQPQQPLQPQQPMVMGGMTGGFANSPLAYLKQRFMGMQQPQPQPMPQPFYNKGFGSGFSRWRQNKFQPQGVGELSQPLGGTFGKFNFMNKLYGR